MLQTVMRPSIDRPRMVGPRYSTRCPCPADVPVRPMRPSTMSFAVMPTGSPHVLPGESAGGADAPGGGDVVVHRRHGQVGGGDFAPRQPQAFECLGGCDLVDEVQIDEQEVRFALCGTHHVGVPQLLGEGLGHGNDNFTHDPGRKFVAWAQPQPSVGSLTFTTSMARPAGLLVLLLGLLGLIGIRTGARAN